MLWIHGTGGVLILFASFFFYPSDNRGLRQVLTTAGIFSAAALLVCFIVQIWPVTHITTKTIQTKYVDPPKVVYRDKIVYQTPGKEFDAVDVRAACTGKFPIEIVNMKESGTGKDPTTWITGRIVGSKILFTCGQPGAYMTNEVWKIGDVVQMTRATPQ